MQSMSSIGSSQGPVSCVGPTQGWPHVSKRGLLGPCGASVGGLRLHVAAPHLLPPATFAGAGVPAGPGVEHAVDGVFAVLPALFSCLERAERAKTMAFLQCMVPMSGPEQAAPPHSFILPRL